MSHQLRWRLQPFGSTFRERVSSTCQLSRSVGLLSLAGLRGTRRCFNWFPAAQLHVGGRSECGTKGGKLRWIKALLLLHRDPPPAEGGATLPDGGTPGIGPPRRATSPCTAARVWHQKSTLAHQRPVGSHQQSLVSRFPRLPCSPGAELGTGGLQGWAAMLQP